MSQNYSSYNIKFYKRSYDLIKTLGDVTQKTIAEYVGVGQSKINDILQFECNPQKYANKEPKAETVVKIAKAFNVSTDYLLGVTDYKTTDRATKELCNTLGLSENTINVLMGGLNSPIADITKKLMANSIFSEADERLISENALGYGQWFAQVIDWLVEDAISVYSKTEFAAGKEKPLIALIMDYINRLDLSNKDGDFEVTEFTQEELPLEKFPHIKGKQPLYTHRFSIENSMIEIVGDDVILPSISELLIDSAIGEINTRLHNIKHEKLGE